MFTIPNFLSFLRMTIAPIIIWLYLKNYLVTCLLLTFFASLTDLFDGLIARKFNQQSSFGSLLDPIADKFFEMTLIAFFAFNREIPIYFAGLFLLRNFAQLLSIPILMGIMKISFKVEPKLPAKWASAMGMIIIVETLLVKAFPWFTVHHILKWLIFPIGSLLEIYMLFTYIPRFIQISKKQHDTFN